jgi:S-formylglutathione hydrolase FrmB
MARNTIRFYSQTLRKQTTVTVVFPDEAPGPWRVVYVLHGLGGDHASWANDFPLDQQLGGRPLMFVCPDGDRSYYVNSTAPDGSQYEDFLSDELPRFVDRTFPTQADRGGRMIAGLSMGGYGAMMLGLKHPETFGAIYSTSGAVYFAACDHPIGSEYPTSLMNAVAAEDYSCLELAAAYAPQDNRPPLKIKIDCGLDDYLLEVNRTLQVKLERLGIAHEYSEHPGAHNHEYWQDRLPDFMQFISEAFDLPIVEKET